MQRKLHLQQKICHRDRGSRAVGLCQQRFTPKHFSSSIELLTAMASGMQETVGICGGTGAVGTALGAGDVI